MKPSKYSTAKGATDVFNNIEFFQALMQTLISHPYVATATSTLGILYFLGPAAKTY